MLALRLLSFSKRRLRRRNRRNKNENSKQNLATKIKIFHTRPRRRGPHDVQTRRAWLSKMVNLSIKKSVANEINFLKVLKQVSKNQSNKQEICHNRSERRAAIMRLTRGRGMKNKITRWNSESYIKCKKE